MLSILAINLGNFGSTGLISKQIAKEAIESGIDYYFAYPSRPENKKTEKKDILICSYFHFRLSRKFSKLFGDNNLISYIITKRFLKKIKKKRIDVFHLHNLHGGFINYKTLFSYIKKNSIRVFWTLHDCWSFTGRCPYFQLSGCEKWKTGCGICIYPKKMYPQALFNKENKMWLSKRNAFTSAKNMTIVTPSKWLACLVKESFLCKYPVTVINNGIDLGVFKPTSPNYRNKFPDCKYLLLGVAFDWSYRKGIDVFIELADRLNDDYRIILVGVDEKLAAQLPDKIISIHKTHNQLELVKLYSSADLFVNPTREENYPTVNMEALACGCPVITFNTGGSPEIIDDKTGRIVPWNDIDDMERQIIDICVNHRFSREDCVKKAKSFDMQDKFKEYISLYKKCN